MISFRVDGKAQTAGSKRAFPFKRKDGRLGVAVSDDNPRSKDWKLAVAWTARQAVGAGFAPLRCALEVEFTFYRARPASHKVGKGGPNKGWREHPFPTSRPDVLKQARAIEDSLSGVLWHDDSQIVTETLRKRWGDAPGVEIRVWEAFE
jgi:Holliday junction resolvase RusA-like endonuclease